MDWSSYSHNGTYARASDKVYEEEYNSLRQMLKDLLEEAYNQQQSI